VDGMLAPFAKLMLLLFPVQLKVWHLEAALSRAEHRECGTTRERFDNRNSLSKCGGVLVNWNNLIMFIGKSGFTMKSGSPSIDSW
jgi:hypothetical protein